MDIIITIGITSYNRIKELQRCIESISTKFVNEIEILVSEDNSPLSEQIRVMINQLSKDIKYTLRFFSNPINLGYDGNLKAIIEKSNGRFVFFMSDDDMMYPNCLDEIIPFLRSDEKYGVYYAPFIYCSSKKTDRYHGKSFEIPAGEQSASKYIYDSILFSGLIFRKEYVLNLDASRFKNYNYFQVYMFLKMLYNYGGYYFEGISVICVGDGENAYGISESSGGNEILANRNSVISNLEFNKTLIKIVRIFDEESSTKVIDSFARQYSLHAYSGLSIAREGGLCYYKQYWKILKDLDIRLFPIAYFYFFCLLIFGKKCSDFFFSGFRRIIKKEKFIDCNIEAQEA